MNNRTRTRGSLDALLQQELAGRSVTTQVSPLPKVTGPAQPLAPQQLYPMKGPGQIPPDSCTPWAFADRGDFELDHVEQLTESLKSEGQIQPAIVRSVPMQQGSPIRYEIIAGRARWLSAARAGNKLDVIVRNLTDEEAFRVMVHENESRKDLCDYSKGKRFRKALDTKLYANARDISRRLAISEATISRLLAAADLDADVVQAFSSPAAISGKLAVALAGAVNAGLKGMILRDAKLIEEGKIRASDIPGVWEAGAQAPTQPPGEEGRKDLASRGAGRSSRKYVSSKGAHLFTVKTRGDRNPVVSFQVALKESFFDDLKSVVEKSLRRGKS